jgi:hypothetical protein
MKILKASGFPTISPKSSPIRIDTVNRRKLFFFFLLENIHEFFVYLPEGFEILSY